MRAPCRMDGCGRESRGRGLCSTHWLRWRKHGDPTVVLQPGVDYSVTPTCSVEGCHDQAKARLLCAKHYRRWRTHGDPLAVSELRGRPLTGPATWYTVHKRLERQRGSARDHACVDCGGPAREWSYDHTDPDALTCDVRGSVLAYSLDLDRYEPRCVRCHRRFDATYRREQAHA